MKILNKVLKISAWTGAIIIFCVFSIFLIVRFTTSNYIWESSLDIPQTEAAVVLGAFVLANGNLSPVLADRVDTAITLYEAGKVRKILVSGDDGTDEYNEVNPIRIYLLEKGIPDENIFLDHAGFDTYSSMYRARDVFLANSITVVTQSFHLSRAVFLARNMGLEAYGMSADDGHYKINNYVRELFANGKAILDLLLSREPKYLGEEIPLTGDGRDNQ